jgi:hypothetical protein
LTVLRCAASSRRSFTNSHTAHPSGTRNPIPISDFDRRSPTSGKPLLTAMVNVDGHHAALSDSIARPNVVVVALRCWSRCFRRVKRSSVASARCCHCHQAGCSAELALGVDTPARTRPIAAAGAGAPALSGARCATARARGRALRNAGRPQHLDARIQFIPTRVGNARRSPAATSYQPVHPHASKECIVGKQHRQTLDVQTTKRRITDAKKTGDLAGPPVIM